ncbi:MAG: DUF4258 domain-containing protein [Magnetococcus sp. DMHC-6]
MIEDYPDDTPYPSSLWLGKDAVGKYLHVVAAENKSEEEKIIITVYHPNPTLWLSDWITRRRKL